MENERKIGRQKWQPTISDRPCSGDGGKQRRNGELVGNK